MAGLAKTLALVMYFFCLAYPQHGIAWNNLSSPPPPFVPSSSDQYNQGCPGSTVPFCGDSSSTTVLKCCDVVAHSAPPDFHHAAVDYSCTDLTCQLCSVPSSAGSASRLICTASTLHLHHDDDGEKQGMSTATTIALLVGGIIVLIVVLGLICHTNLRIGMGMVVKMILGNRNEQNINVHVDSDTKAEAGAASGAAAGALALSRSDATAMANANANAEAILEARWYLVDGQWVLLDSQWTVVFVDGQAIPLPEHLRRALPKLPPQHGGGGRRLTIGGKDDE